MVEINIVYEGDLHTRAVHGPSGQQLETDAPKDNQGRGEAFSPSDLVATALGACMMTIMGIVAKRRNLDLARSQVKVQKHMLQEPVRRIGKLAVTFALPSGLAAADRRVLETAAFTCPVHHSLHPDIEIAVDFRYTL